MKSYNYVKALEEVGNIIFTYTKHDLVGTQLMTYLAVCTHEGINMQDLADYLDAPQGSLSRNVKKLGIYKDKNGERAGYGLFDVRPDYENRRTLAIYLSDKGRELRAEIEKTFKDANDFSMTS